MDQFADKLLCPARGADKICLEMRSGSREGDTSGRRRQLLSRSDAPRDCRLATSRVDVVEESSR